MNNVNLVGNLGAAPELRHLDNGTAVASLRVCTSEKWTDKATGEQKEKSEWHSVTVWGAEAESLMRAGVTKGTRVMVAGGSLETREFDGRDGEKRSKTEVIVRWPRGQIGIVPRSDDRQGDRTERRVDQPRAGNATRDTARRPSRDA